jgi:L-threonylcarbamoyladenylate synthase
LEATGASRASGHADEGEMKPLTIIYPGAKNVAENLLAEDGSLGIRITEEPFSKNLCAMLRHPLVSTSANISGQPAARSFREISDEIKQGVDYICKYRQKDPCKGKPSSIVKLGVNNEVSVIRA